MWGKTVKVGYTKKQKVYVIKKGNSLKGWYKGKWVPIDDQNDNAGNHYLLLRLGDGIFYGEYTD